MNPNNFYACGNRGFRSPAMPMVGGDLHCPSATNVRGYHNNVLQIKAKSSDIIQWIKSSAGVDAARLGAAIPARPFTVDMGATRQCDLLSG
jgi:hypothetical protein